MKKSTEKQTGCAGRRIAAAIALCFLVAILLLAAPFIVAKEAPLVNGMERSSINAYDGFSRVQGGNGWRYTAISRENRAEYELFAGDTDQYGMAGVDGVWIAKRGDADGLLQPGVGEIAMHTGEMYGTQISYTIETAGVIDVYGEVRRFNVDFPEPGVNWRVLKNEEQIFPQAGGGFRINDLSVLEYAVTDVSVAIGDVIRFELNHNGDPDAPLQSDYWGTETRVSANISYQSSEAASSIVLNDLRKDIVATVGDDPLQLKAVLLPGNNAGGITYASTDEDVVSVSQTGVVSFLSPGEAAIELTSADDPSVSRQINVLVNAKFTYLHSHGLREEFSAENGGNGWRYLYESIGAEGTYLAMDYGNNNYTSEGGTAIWTSADTMAVHPGPDRNAVIGYVLPASGEIRLDDTLYKTAGDGDGVRVRIFLDAQKVFPAEEEWLTISPDSTVNISVPSLQVNKGQTVYFVVNKNETTYFDELHWSPTIYYIQDLSPVCAENEQSFVCGEYVQAQDAEFAIDTKEQALTALYVNEEPLSAEAYSFADGKLVIGAACLQDLGEGTHTFRFETAGGSCSLIVRVADKNPSFAEGEHYAILTASSDVVLQADMKGGNIATVFLDTTELDTASYTYDAESGELTLALEAVVGMGFEDGDAVSVEVRTEYGSASTLLYIAENAAPSAEGLTEQDYDKVSAAGVTFAVRLKGQPWVGLYSDGQLLNETEFSLTEQGGVASIVIGAEYLEGLENGQSVFSVQTSAGSVSFTVNVFSTAPSVAQENYYFDLAMPGDIVAKLELFGYEVTQVLIGNEAAGEYTLTGETLTLPASRFAEAELWDKIAVTVGTERGTVAFYVNVIDSHPSLEQDEFAFDRTVSDADLFVRVITSGKDVTAVAVDGEAIPESAYSYDGAHLTIEKEYLAGLANKSYTVTVSTESGSVSFTLTVTGNADDIAAGGETDGTGNDGENDASGENGGETPPPAEDGEEGGCGSAVYAASLGAALLSVIAAAVLLRRRQ